MQFSVFLSDGYIMVENNSKKWINGKVWLKENENIIWIKKIERPINAVVSDNGKVTLLQTIYINHSKSSSKTTEFQELGGKLTVMEKFDKPIFTYDFESNLESCSISSDGNLVSVATLSPDNSIYCFDLGQKRLLWKYKNHARRKVLKLQFKEDKIEVFTGLTLTTIKNILC